MFGIISYRGNDAMKNELIKIDYRMESEVGFVIVINQTGPTKLLLIGISYFAITDSYNMFEVFRHYEENLVHLE